MSLKPEVLDALLAAGATADMIVAAVKADLASEEARKQAKRANNAERQRRFKAKRNAAVTEDNADNALPDVTNAQTLSPAPSPQTPQPHPHTRVYNTPRAKEGLPAKPADVETQVWADFVAHRKAKRAPVSETVIAGIRREAEKAGCSLQTALAETVSRGWQGFKAEWMQGNVSARDGPPGNDFLAHYAAKRGIA